FPKSPQCLQHYCNHHGLHAIEQPLRLGKFSVARVSPGERRHNECCRQNETHSCHEEARPTTAPVTNVNRQLGGIGAGNEVCCAQQVEKFVTRKPPTPCHHFVFHHRDVCGRTAECGGAQ